MTSFRQEVAVSIPCAGETLIGVMHRGAPDARYGLVLVVGGPQYRVGSHRQFVMLARSVARAGIPVLRFDVRGMGDSSGAFSGFEHIGEDIRAAIDSFATILPQVKGITLWGLCDAASAITFYAYMDARVCGIALLNPWIRTEATQARAWIRHYYVRRFTDIDAWRRLFTGKLNVIGAGVEMLRTAYRAFVSCARGPRADIQAMASSLPDRMAAGLNAFKGSVLLILSGNDLTAREFADVTSRSELWQHLLSSTRIMRHEIAEADHTFSRADCSQAVTAYTIHWLEQITASSSDLGCMQASERDSGCDSNLSAANLVNRDV